MSYLMEYAIHIVAIATLLLGFIFNRIRQRKKISDYNHCIRATITPVLDASTEKTRKVVKNGMCFYYGD